MAIGRRNGIIISAVSAEKDFNPKGLSCGFILLEREFEAGDNVYLTDGKRKLKVEIRNDVRPGRTARMPIREMV
jgi:aminomethyltransferase